VTVKNIGTSQILFLVKYHPWVADAKAKLPRQAMINIRIPSSQVFYPQSDIKTILSKYWFPELNTSRKEKKNLVYPSLPEMELTIL